MYTSSYFSVSVIPSNWRACVREGVLEILLSETVLSPIDCGYDLCMLF